MQLEEITLYHMNQVDSYTEETTIKEVDFQDEQLRTSIQVFIRFTRFASTGGLESSGKLFGSQLSG